MGKTDFIPLFKAACYLVYGKQEYDKWVSTQHPNRKPHHNWILYVLCKAPPPEQPEYEKNAKGRLIETKADPHKKFIDYERNLVRAELKKIIKRAADQNNGILKGKAPGETEYVSIPVDFMLLVNDGLEIAGGENVHLSDKLVFSGHHFLKKGEKSGRLNLRYADVLVDWSAINKTLTRKKRSGRKPKYKWEEIREQFDELYEYEGGFDPDAEDGFTTPAAASILLRDKLEAHNIEVPDEKYLAKKIRIWAAGKN